MRIYELTGYKAKPEIGDIKQGLKGLEGRPEENVRTQVLSQFLESMKAKGYHVIGHGVFGAVLTHPQVNYAIKIFKNDPAYLKFVKYAVAHQDRPLLPKFRGRFMNLKDDFYVVRMELLQPLQMTPIVKAQLGILMFLGDDSFLGIRDHSEKGYLEFVQKHPARARQYCGSGVSDEIIQAQAQALIDAGPGNAATCILDLREITATSKSLNMDMKFDNFMMRGQQLVLIDPLWDHMVVA